MNEIIFEIREDETDGGFVARALGQSIVTQADTWDELRTNVREAPTIVCSNCEKRVPLWDDLEQWFASPDIQRRVSSLREKSAIV